MVSRTVRPSPALVVTALVCLLGFGCDSPTGEPEPTVDACSNLSGTWNIALDYGNGMVTHQNWLISQNVCELTLTGDPPDPYGVGLDAAPQSGFARTDFFHASWVKTARCRISCSIDANVNGNTFTGQLLWIESPCEGFPGSFRTVDATGSR
jgi:hypothetical protein